ncbi:MAG: hypothetical protein ACC651_17340, partial [Candidatus Scalindua sp.]
ANRRELAQLQGEPIQPNYTSDGFIDDVRNEFEGAHRIIGQEVINPVREFLGFEKRQPGTYINPVEQWQASETERKINLAEGGIRSGKVNLRSRFVEGLAMDDKNRVLAVKKNLQEQFGADVKVGIDKKTNEPVYVNPTDGLMYTIDPIGADYGDAAGFVGDAITLTFEALGTMGGAVLAGKKKAVNELKKMKVTDDQYSKMRRNREVGWGAAGAAVGDAFKIMLGKQFDINDDVAYSEIAIDAAKEASLSAGFGVGFEALKAGMKKIKGVVGDSVIPAHILDKFGRKLDAIDEKNIGTEIGNNQFIDAMNDTLREAQADQVIRPNVAQLTGDTDLLDLVESLKKTGAPERKPVLTREEANLAGQKEYFTIIGKEVTDTQPLGSYQLGQDIQAVTNKSLNAEVQRAEAQTVAAIDKSKELTQGLNKTTPYKAGDIVRNSIYEEEAIFKGVADKEYRILEKKALDLNLIPDTTDMKLNLALIDSGETGVKKERIVDLFNEGDLDLDADWSLSKINQSIKDLRAQSKSFGSSKSDVQKGSMLKAIAVLTEAKRQALKSDPDLLLKMDALDKLYSDGMEIFNDGISK